MKKRYVTLTGIILTLLFLMPLIWLYLTAFKDRVDLFAVPPKIIFSATLDNFKVAFVEREFYKPLFNSILVSTTSTIIALIFSITGAYAFSRNKTKWKKEMFFLLFSVQILPPVVIVLPLFLIFSFLQLSGTIFALILVYVAMLIPFGCILLKSYFDKIPLRYEEVAFLENIPFKFFFFKIFIREARMPIFITAFFMFLLCWNEFLFSMIFSTVDTVTLPVSILGLITPIGTFWGQIAAISIVSTMPIIILSFLFRKHLLSGFSFGIISND